MLKVLGHDFAFYQPAFCHLPFNRVILSADGYVSMCCHQRTQLGRLTEDTEILDFWNSPLAKEIRKSTTNGKLHPVCASWSSCPFLVRKKEPYDVPMYPRSVFPMRLELCLPDAHCNIGGNNPTKENPACIMCRRNWEKPNQPDITEFLCRKTKPLMPYLRELSVLGIAEPFWKGEIFKVYEMLEFHRYKHQCHLRTNTNVLCLNEKTIRRFFAETDCSDLSFSIDAASPEVFKKVRRLDAYDILLENAKNYLKIRDEFGGTQKHKVCIYNNINLLNVDQMVMMVEMAVELGVDNMAMVPTHDQQGVVALGEFVLCQKNVHVFKKAAEDAMKRANQLGLCLDYPNRFDVPPPVSPVTGAFFPKEAVEEVIQLEIPDGLYTSLLAH